MCINTEVEEKLEQEVVSHVKNKRTKEKEKEHFYTPYHYANEPLTSITYILKR